MPSLIFPSPYPPTIFPFQLHMLLVNMAVEQSTGAWVVSQKQQLRVL